MIDWNVLAQQIVEYAPAVAVLMFIVGMVGIMFMRVLGRILDANDRQLEVIVQLCNRRCPEVKPALPE